MITLNDNINDNTHAVQGKMIAKNDNICKLWEIITSNDNIK